MDGHNPALGDPFEDPIARSVVPAHARVAEPEVLVALPKPDAIAKRDLAAAHKRLGAAFPEGGWLDAYIQAALPLTNSPIEFHMIAGLAALSATYGNRVYRDYHGKRLYPHIWTVIVAGSSFWHKSTAVDIATDLLFDACPDALLANQFTSEALLKNLSEKPGGLATFSEFGDLLASANRDYNGQLKSLLLTLFDSPRKYERSTIGKSGAIVHSPAMTFLAATTISNIEEKLSKADIDSGFLPRFLWVTADNRETERDDDEGQMNSAWRNRLVKGLARLARVGPPMPYQAGQAAPIIEPARIVLTDSAKRVFNEWRRGWEQETGGADHAFDLSGFATRLEAYAQKLAILYRASACAFDESMNPLVIDADDMTAAIAYTRLLWASMARTMDHNISLSDSARELKRVLDIVAKGSPKNNALNRSKMKEKDFATLVDTHLATGALVVEDRMSTAAKKPRPVAWLVPGPNHPQHSAIYAADEKDDEQLDAIEEDFVARRERDINRDISARLDELEPTFMESTEAA
jgi:hypothetical protein